MVPVDFNYQGTVEMYGPGAACKYSADWKGSVAVSSGEKAEGTLSEFSVTEAGVLYCSGEDAWGNYTFQGMVTNKEVAIDKIYNGSAEVIKLNGTLTTSALQGTWILGDMNGTFLYTPK